LCQPKLACRKHEKQLCSLKGKRSERQPPRTCQVEANMQQQNLLIQPYFGQRLLICFVFVFAFSGDVNVDAYSLLAYWQEASAVWAEGDVYLSDVGVRTSSILVFNLHKTPLLYSVSL
jgi:hypothetical protein